MVKPYIHHGEDTAAADPSRRKGQSHAELVRLSSFKNACTLNTQGALSAGKGRPLLCLPKGSTRVHIYIAKYNICPTL